MKATRFITRKPCKDCGVYTSALLTENHPGRGQESGKPVFRHASGWVCVSCRVCGKPRIANEVRGKFSDKHECNAKCLGSRGQVCECSCGGVNHGASYAAPSS